MADIDSQLRDKCRKFLHRTGLTQRQLSKELGEDSSNFNAWLAGCKTLSVAKTAKLWNLMRLDKAQLVVKLLSQLVTVGLSIYRNLVNR